MNRKHTVKEVILDCLENYAFEDAIFTAERLLAEENNEESLFLLATSLYWAGRKTEACTVLQENRPTSARTKFLLLKCFADTNRFENVKMFLSGDYSRERTLNEAIYKIFGKRTGYVLQIMGDMHYKMGNRDLGKYFLRDSLFFNPTLWASYEKLAAEKVLLKPQYIFQFDRYLKYNSGDLSQSKHIKTDVLTFTARVISGNEINVNVSPQVLKPQKTLNDGGADKLSKASKVQAVSKKSSNKTETNGSVTISESNDGGQPSTSVLKTIEKPETLETTVETLLTLFKDIGLVKHYSLKNDRDSAVKAFNQLPSHYRDSTSILFQIENICGEIVKLNVNQHVDK